MEVDYFHLKRLISNQHGLFESKSYLKWKKKNFTDTLSMIGR